MAKAIYNSGWEREDISTRKSILIMMIRAQRPARLRIEPYFDFNYEASAKVCERNDFLLFFKVIILTGAENVLVVLHGPSGFK